jgi:hypothetical protein
MRRFLIVAGTVAVLASSHIMPAHALVNEDTQTVPSPAAQVVLAIHQPNPSLKDSTANSAVGESTLTAMSVPAPLADAPVLRPIPASSAKMDILPATPDAAGPLSKSSDAPEAGSAANWPAPAAAAPSAPRTSLDPVRLAQAGTAPVSSPQAIDSPYPFAPMGATRRSLPQAIDNVFPFQEWVGPTIGVPDTNSEWPLERALYKACPTLKKARIQIYGWGNPGMGYSSSHQSNIPLSYAIVPRRLEMDQLVLRIERNPDTVQTEHCDWGFRMSNLFGIDYRYTAAPGWNPAGRELLKHNRLYGYDPVELYAQLYVPKVAQGMLVKFGRYISPPDIEAQLAPDNFLWTHSQMFTVDCYTQTGVLAAVKLNNNWTAMAGIHAGNDMAPWYKGAVPTGEAFLKWTSKSNNDSILFGVDAINNGRYRFGKTVGMVNQMQTAINTLTGVNAPPPHVSAHDNLQQFNVTWGHRFNRRVNMFNEFYYLYSYDALMGGTVNNGPGRNYNLLTGPGAFLPGTSNAYGMVNYTNIKISNKDYITIRPVDYLFDLRGWRTGFPTIYSTWTVGWCHRFSDRLCIRPEIRYERSLISRNGVPVTPYDNGRRMFQFTFGLDVIKRF